VNCEVCGTELPHGAMFCGECGRAVGLRSVGAVHPDSGMPVAPSSASAPVASSRDTVILEPITKAFPELESELEPQAHVAREPEEVPKVYQLDEVDDVYPVDEVEDVEQDLAPEIVAEELSADHESPASEAGFVERGFTERTATPPAAPVESPSAVDAVLAARGAAPTPPPIIEPASSAPPLSRPDPFPWGDRGSAIFIDSDEIEQTLIVPRREAGERFVLQFSTGESITVFGSGLLGRNPTPQPSEYFDQLVSISDPGKSVSKTHLEFGQEAGAFWVSDRYSGNGSVVREPESAPRRLVAGKRYRIVRGTRVDIGEQFFVVS